MAKPGQSSFRRILLSRILLLSVPVLLMGVYVTYRKARSSILETARQNLTESAVRKGESMSESIKALSANLVTASEAVVLQSRSPEAHQKFLNQLVQQLPTQVQCIQLINVEMGNIAASTCGKEPISTLDTSHWPQQQKELLLDTSKVQVKSLLPGISPLNSTVQENQPSPKSQLRLIFSAPVYDSTGSLRYALSVQSALLKQERAKPGSLSGYPVVIDQDGTILAHPITQRVGRNIKQEADGERLETVMKNAIAGRNDFLHLFSFEKNGVELLAGYTPIPSPISNQPDRQWVILAVTRLDSALSGLKEIQQVLVILTFGLIAASLLATLYISRELALPLEQLRDYAGSKGHFHSTDPVPQNFKIREFNQLSEALDNMVERLKAWAEEIETAWKEAQAANQLKNEFLANTSHELRTPLNAIIGCIRLVRDDCCDDREEEMDFLQRADDAAIHLLGIINDVLDIAKIEAGKLSVVMEPVDLRKLLKEVIDLQAVPIQQKGLQFNTPDLPESIPVRTDPAKLKQVLLNVVGNATKFTEKGSVTITTRIETSYGKEQAVGNSVPPSSHLSNGVAQTATVSNEEQTKIQAAASVGNGQEVRGEDASSTSNGASNLSRSLLTGTANSLKERLVPSARVVVTVHDTGIGIDPNQQHKLFRPFVMIDGTTTRKFGGTGLGLAISRNLMELMGGNITLSSAGAGLGTTVEIAVPMIDTSVLPTLESTNAAKN